MLILSELVTTGYPAMDLLERAHFREKVYELNEEIVEHTGKTALVFGTITPNNKATGRPCYNSAIVAQNGKQIQQVHKSLLPTYDVYDELRYFEPATEQNPVEIDGVSFGVTVCEDIWYNYSTFQYHNYSVNPAAVLAEKGAQAILNLSASPYGKSASQARKNMLQTQADNIGIPIFYVNQLGANTELVSDGDCLAFDENGKLISRTRHFDDMPIDVELNKADGTVTALQDTSRNFGPLHKEKTIFEALTFGLKEYLRKSGLPQKVILGLSGGIDSALVAVIAKEALGADNVKAVTMPSEFSTEGSVTDSEILAENLGIELMHIPIKNIYGHFLTALNPLFADTEFNVAEENLQSRARGDILMAIANKFGYMVLNTGNKSELAVGYCTMYGDMAGGLSLLSDLYKTEVYDVCRWLNEDYYAQEVIPESTLTKAPSAELRPDQKDTDSLPDYEVLDTILRSYLEEHQSAKEIIARGIAAEDVERTLKLLHLSEYKRFQASPGLKLSSKAFGTGRRWPLVQQWQQEELK